MLPWLIAGAAVYAGSKIAKAVIERKLFCSNCGVELKVGQKFCAECGTRVE